MEKIWRDEWIFFDPDLCGSGNTSILHHWKNYENNMILRRLVLKKSDFYISLHELKILLPYYSFSAFYMYSKLTVKDHYRWLFWKNIPHFHNMSSAIEIVLKFA